MGLQKLARWRSLLLWLLVAALAVPLPRGGEGAGTGKQSTWVSCTIHFCMHTFPPWLALLPAALLLAVAFDYRECQSLQWLPCASGQQAAAQLLTPSLQKTTIERWGIPDPLPLNP